VNIPRTSLLCSQMHHLCHKDVSFLFPGQVLLRAAGAFCLNSYESQDGSELQVSLSASVFICSFSSGDLSILSLFSAFQHIKNDQVRGQWFSVETAAALEHVSSAKSHPWDNSLFEKFEENSTSLAGLLEDCISLPELLWQNSQITWLKQFVSHRSRNWKPRSLCQQT
jgi:hypothetical protein